MTPSEIQTLIVGIALGGATVNGVHAWLAGRDASRAAAEAQVAAKRAAGDHYLSSFRLYLVKQRAAAMRGQG